jgi:hypothetical protein
MPEPILLRLAQELEWLGCELEFYGHKHAMEGYPHQGATWDTFRDKQRGFMITAQKIEHELKNAIRYNPSLLVGVAWPLEDALESITGLLGAIEDIKQAAIFDVDRLPHMVRGFTKTVQGYLSATGAVTR